VLSTACEIKQNRDALEQTRSGSGRECFFNEKRTDAPEDILSRWNELWGKMPARMRQPRCRSTPVDRETLWC
jgi:hypothetical protein